MKSSLTMMALILMLLPARSAFAAIASNELASEAANDHLIQLKAISEVEGGRDEVLIGDVMITRGVSEKALDLLRGIRLVDAPRAGESRSFTALALEQIFRPLLLKIEQTTGEKISLRTPTRVTVVRKSFHLRTEDIELAMRTQLTELCADCSFEISHLTLPAVPANIPSGSTWSVRVNHELPKGNFSLPLEVNYEDTTKRTYWLSGNLTVTRKVPVASRSIMAGEKILSEDYTMQTRDVTFANDVAAATSDLASSVAARPIAAGQVVWRSVLKREQAVKNGDFVRVIAGADGWQITIDGIAQGAGYIGDTVNVKIPRTQKLLSGLLVEKGVVEVR